MSGKPIDEAVLSGRDTAFYLRWALDVLAEHGLEEFSLTIQHVHAEAERHLALTAAQQQGQGQGGGEVVAWRVPVLQSPFGERLDHGVRDELVLVMHRGAHGWKAAGHGHALLAHQLYVRNVEPLCAASHEVAVVGLSGGGWRTVWARSDDDVTHPAPPSAPVEVEDKARSMFEAQADKLAVSWDRQWEPTKDFWRKRAAEALAQQPAPVGVELSALRVQEWLQREYDILPPVQEIEQAMRTPCSCPDTERALAQQPAAPSGEAGAFDANFLQSVASLCRAAYDLCQPTPQRTPEDPREHYGELCLLELASIADEIERRLAAADAAQPGGSDQPQGGAAGGW